MSDPGKEAEQMYHYMHTDPHLIKGRNERMRAEMSKVRLEKRLRGDRAPDSRLVDFALRLKSALRSLRRTPLAGR